MVLDGINLEDRPSTPREQQDSETSVGAKPEIPDTRQAWSCSCWASSRRGEGRRVARREGWVLPVWGILQGSKDGTSMECGIPQ